MNVFALFLRFFEKKTLRCWFLSTGNEINKHQPEYEMVQRSMIKLQMKLREISVKFKLFVMIREEIVENGMSEKFISRLSPLRKNIIDYGHFLIVNEERKSESVTYR